MGSSVPVDGDSNIYFPAVSPVYQFDKQHSGQQKQVADAINARILSGLGDVHWRCLHTAHSFVRKLRNGDGGSPESFPAEDEWWTLYGLYTETDYDWPVAGPGFAEGLNLDQPMNAYFFGFSTTIDPEGDRKNAVPLRDPPVSGPVPTTHLQRWDLGKIQRGAILAAYLTDFSYAPAMETARFWEGINSAIVAKSWSHKTPGGKIDLASTAFNREKGQQVNQMRTQFLTELRGTDSERNDDPSWQPSALTVAYESMLESQYFLAPSYAILDGYPEIPTAQYPLFEWDLLDSVGTYGTWADGFVIYDSHTNHTNFSFAGFILVGENLGSSFRSVAFELDGVRIQTLHVNNATPSSMVWFPVPHKGTIRCLLLDTLVGSEDVWVEMAELLDHKPEVFDLYLYLRMKTARSNSPTIYRGKIIDSAPDLSSDYFDDGCIVNGTNAEVPTETKLAKHPQYQAMRDFLIRWFRIVDYKALVGYYVNGEGNSVLVFDRRGAGSDADADRFQDLAPVEAYIGNNSIRPDVYYEVVSTGGGTAGVITYNGNDYVFGDQFKGTFIKSFDDSAALSLEVKEAFFLVDIEDIDATGESNEWVFSIGGQTVYKDVPGSTYEPDNYGNQQGAFIDRCHQFSYALDGLRGSSEGKEFHRYGAFLSAAPEIATRVETPPGHRYEGDDVPYHSTSRRIYSLVDTADGVDSVDCRDSIWGVNPQVSDSDGLNCDGIVAHYESCQVYKAPYKIKAIRQEGSDVNYIEVELDGRLTRSTSAPSTIADDEDSRTTYLSTDTGPRTDENTVVGVLKWWFDAGTEDEERIGDLSANAELHYVASEIKGAVLCRFFFQRLMPQVINDSNTTIEPTHDRRAYSDPVQYAEFIVRASVGGFLDEQTVLDTLVSDEGSPAYCTGQTSRDLTMARLMELVNANGAGQDRLPIRRTDDHPGYGVLPYTKTRADMWRELGQALNILKAARFGVPVYLESRTMTYWKLYDATIETIEGWDLVRGFSFINPRSAANLKSSGTWNQENLPFDDNAEAYMTIYSDGAKTGVLCYWREVEWRMRPHPKVVEAVPDILKAFVDSIGLGVPFISQGPSRVKSTMLRDPIPSDTLLTDFTGLDVQADPAEACGIGQSGTLAPTTPPTGDLVVSTAYTGTPGGTAGDAESFSRSTMGVWDIGETYIRIPVK